MLPSSSLVKGIALVLCLLGTTGDPLEQIQGHRDSQKNHPAEGPACAQSTAHNGYGVVFELMPEIEKGLTLLPPPQRDHLE
jgi:hypothetical protein